MQAIHFQFADLMWKLYLDKKSSLLWEIIICEKQFPLATKVGRTF